MNKKDNSKKRNFLEENIIKDKFILIKNVKDKCFFHSSRYAEFQVVSKTGGKYFGKSICSSCLKKVEILSVEKGLKIKFVDVLVDKDNVPLGEKWFPHVGKPKLKTWKGFGKEEKIPPINKIYDDSFVWAWEYGEKIKCSVKTSHGDKYYGYKIKYEGRDYFFTELGAFLFEIIQNGSFIFA